MRHDHVEMLRNHGSKRAWHGQWTRPSLCTFILKELNSAECEGLACETKHLLTYTDKQHWSEGKVGYEHFGTELERGQVGE